MESTPQSEEIAVAQFLLSFPRGIEECAQAVAVFNGEGEIWRMTHALKNWKKHEVGMRLFLIAGYFDEREKKDPESALGLLKKPPFSLVSTDSIHIKMDTGNTKEQAEWVAEMVREFDIKSLALYVSHYHLVRAFRALLREFIKRGMPWISLIPVPVTISPEVRIPGSNVSAWALVPGEQVRIERYQGTGDVATPGEVREYLDWFWSHSPLVEDWLKP
jgi:hypothetical protein